MLRTCHNGLSFQLLYMCPAIIWKSNSAMASASLHTKCICGTYPQSHTERQTVPKDKVDWNIPWSEYHPPSYTSEKLKKASYADQDIKNPEFRPNWNAEDGKLNRKSHTGPYKIVDGCPQNPVGRTGLQGRGKLGRWGPNHAGDPVVTRWKTDKNGNMTYHCSEQPILQFVAIQRSDSDEWALPGGMVDPGEDVEDTIKREFTEEALESEKLTEKEKALNKQVLDKYFKDGVEVYRGYVDDPRNTDNAWMETVALHFHDETGSGLRSLKLQAGSDAKGVQWKDVSQDLQLYANHSEILHNVAQRLKARW